MNDLLQTLKSLEVWLEQCYKYVPNHLKKYVNVEIGRVIIAYEVIQDLRLDQIKILPERDWKQNELDLIEIAEQRRLSRQLDLWEPDSELICKFLGKECK